MVRHSVSSSPHSMHQFPLDTVHNPYYSQSLRARLKAAPPALVPLEIILSALPGILTSLYRKYLTEIAFKSTITAGAFQYTSHLFPKVLPLAQDLPRHIHLIMRLIGNQAFHLFHFRRSNAPGISSYCIWEKYWCGFALYFPTDLFLKYSSGIDVIV